MGIFDGLLRPEDQTAALVGALGAGAMGATQGRTPLDALLRAVSGGASGLTTGITAGQNQYLQQLDAARKQQLMNIELQKYGLQQGQYNLDKEKFDWQKQGDTLTRATALDNLISAQDKLQREESGRTALGMLAGKDYDPNYKYPDGTTSTDAVTQLLATQSPDLYKDYATLTKPKEYRSTAVTLYGPGGKTKQVAIPEGENFTPPAGWTLAKPEKPEADTTAARNYKEYAASVRARGGTPPTFDQWYDKFGLNFMSQLLGGGDATSAPVPAPVPAPAPKPTAPASGVTATVQGNNVVVNGKSYALGSDGTVTIEGKKYRVQK